MTLPALYNEIDPYCCDALRALIALGWIPAGDVLEKDVRLVHPDELRGYGQIHLFAGIGGGALACRLAGVPDDFRIITAGVPCQPASQAGKRLGADDARWLWPEFFRLLRELRHHYALVEQPPGIVSLNDGVEWRWILGTMAELVSDFEVSRVSAADVGAPQERERVWIVAYPNDRGAEPGTAQRADRGRSTTVGERRELFNESPDRGDLLGNGHGEGRRLGGQPERPELERASGAIADRSDEGVGDGDGDGDGGRREQHHEGNRVDAVAGARHVPMVDAASRGRGARGALGVQRADGGCEELGDAGGTGREERVAAAIAGESGHVAGECCELGEPGCGRVQRVHDARGASAIGREDEREEVQRERGRRDARDYGELIRPWADAVAVRGFDDTVRLIPREAAETGPESPLWPVADGIPGRVARLRSIGNAWVPQAAVPALRVILAHCAGEAAA